MEILSVSKSHLASFSSRPASNYLIPTIIDKVGGTERAYDIYSRLLEDRIIFLNDPIDSGVSGALIAQLLFLDKANSKEPIHMYINSPGGHVTAGLAIYDTMQLIKAPVYTYCTGIAASMASIILVGGKKWHRYITANSEVLIHQPLGGVEGQAADIKIAADNIIRTGEVLYGILAKHTGQDIDTIRKDCDRDNTMLAEQSLKYGLVDKIL